ncbi:glycosyl transferase group 1 [filamentous cyanobacterium CCP5]|nr:glycosyl transferase group 1 [filamentous cyanobacterium CCP5]
MNQIRISFAPYFTDANPYQVKLLKALHELDVLAGGISFNVVFLPVGIETKKVNLVHLHWLHKYSHAYNKPKSILRVIKFICGLIVLKISKVKIVWTAHNIKDHESVFPLADRICNEAVATLADAIIAHSEAAKREISEHFIQINQEKVFVIPHGNYLSSYENTLNQEAARRRLNLPQSAFVFLFFGLIRPYKGILELVQAFKELNCEDAYLLIAGSSKDDALTQQIGEEAENNSRIQFHPGFVPDEKIQVYMNAANAVVLPYRNFLTSGALVLSMSFGRTCIAPRVGCIQETLNDDIAFLYDPNNDDGLLQAMSRALDQRHDCEAMGQANLAIAKEYSWDKVAEMTLDVYQHCLNDR